MKAYRGRRYIAPLILNLGTRWWYWSNLRPGWSTMPCLCTIISQLHICTRRLHPRPLSSSSTIHIGHVTCLLVRPYLQKSPTANGQCAVVWYLTVCLTDKRDVDSGMGDRALWEMIFFALWRREYCKKSPCKHRSAIENGEIKVPRHLRAT